MCDVGSFFFLPGAKVDGLREGFAGQLKVGSSLPRLLYKVLFLPRLLYKVLFLPRVAHTKCCFSLELPIQSIISP